MIFLRAVEMAIKSGIRFQFGISGFSTTDDILGLFDFPFNIPLCNDVPDLGNRSLLKEIELKRNLIRPVIWKVTLAVVWGRVPPGRKTRGDYSALMWRN